MLLGGHILLTTSPNPGKRDEIIIFEDEDDGTYSMEAWMMASRFTLCATDHARSAGVIRGLGGCT